MRDTSEKFAALYRERLDALQPEQRGRMALEAFDFARTIARAGILHDEPHLTDVEVEKKLFLRFYGRDLPPAQIERVLRGIDDRRLGRTRILKPGARDTRRPPLHKPETTRDR